MAVIFVPNIILEFCDSALLYKHTEVYPNIWGSVGIFTSKLY